MGINMGNNMMGINIGNNFLRINMGNNMMGINMGNSATAWATPHPPSLDVEVEVATRAD